MSGKQGSLIEREEEPVVRPALEDKDPIRIHFLLDFQMSPDNGIQQKMKDLHQKTSHRGRT
jgi:hypothetical protein